MSVSASSLSTLHSLTTDCGQRICFALVFSFSSTAFDEPFAACDSGLSFFAFEILIFSNSLTMAPLMFAADFAIDFLISVRLAFKRATTSPFLFPPMPSMINFGFFNVALNLMTENNRRCQFFKAMTLLNL